MSMSFQPLRLRIPRTRSGSAKAKRPGASGSAGGEGGRYGAAARPGMIAIGLSAGLRQQANTSSAPGFRPLRMLAKAASKSLKNMTPNRDMAASKFAPPKS